MLLPTDNTALRRNLDFWFESHEIHPVVIGEFEDYALLSIHNRLSECRLSLLEEQRIPALRNGCRLKAEHRTEGECSLP